MTEEEFRSKDTTSHLTKVDAFDYMAEADKTCSVIFNPQNVDRDAFVELIGRIIEDAKHLNVVKKLLFRGKTPAEVGTSEPKRYDSLAVDFDGMNVATGEIDILHGLIGVITEAGEMAEILMERIHQGEFDTVNINEECGDVTWYLARQLRGISAARRVNVTFETMQRANIDKLHGRHGEAFDVFRDANRDLVAERAQLETALPMFEHAGGVADEVAQAVLQDPRDTLDPYERGGPYGGRLDATDHTTRDADRDLQADFPSNVGIGSRKRTGIEPAGVVERFERKPAGDCEGTDC